MFDTSKLILQPLASRKNKMRLDDFKGPRVDFYPDYWSEFIWAVKEARRNDKPVIVAMGAHPIKLDLGGYLIKLIEHGVITHLATNGAGLIHDLEIAMIGETSEDVAENLPRGTFGLWKETLLEVNSILDYSYTSREGNGIGEAAGMLIYNGVKYQYSNASIFAEAYRKEIPATVHVNIGQDISFMDHHCSAAAWGECSYNDFLIFTESISHLEGGVFINLGSAVMGPEIFQKALSMARNVAHQEGRRIKNFTTAIFDLKPYSPFGEDEDRDPNYYNRPIKTLGNRAVLRDGQSFYFEGDHRDTIPALVRDLCPRP